MCRDSIADHATRITWADGSILIDKEFRVSNDGGHRWSEEYDDLDAILSDYLPAGKLKFERYSPIRDHTTYYAEGTTHKEHQDLIRTFTFFPQDQTDDDHVHRLIDGIDPGTSIRFTQKQIITDARFWLSVVWTHNREIWAADRRPRL
jgi:hypothetical protein